ncbi:hypothetical protein BDW62DRAFT_200814 [Aspergillus aurantiobrunneus]
MMLLKSLVFSCLAATTLASITCDAGDSIKKSDVQSCIDYLNDIADDDCVSDTPDADEGIRYKQFVHAGTAAIQGTNENFTPKEVARCGDIAAAAQAILDSCDGDTLNYGTNNGAVKHIGVSISAPE